MTLYRGKVANQQARSQARATMMSSVLTGIGQLAGGYTPNAPTFGEVGTPTPTPTPDYPIAPIGTFPSFSRSMSGFRTG